MIERRSLREMVTVVDRPSLIVLAAIFVIGLLSIYSAGNGVAGNGLYYAGRQMIWVLTALVLSVLLWRIDFKWLLHWSYVIYSVSCLALVGLLVMGLRAKGAQSWFAVGNLSLQPSEFVKITLALVLAEHCQRSSPQTWPRFLGVLALGGVAGLLVLVQPDLGSTLVYAVMIFAALWTAGTPGLFLGLLIGTGLASLPVLWTGLKEYQRNRLLVFIEPSLDPLGAGYNVIQSRIAVGSGRLLGKGFMQGTQSKLRFLPEPHTDFVFSVFAEEFGFVGCCLLLTLYAVLLWRLTTVALRTREAADKVWIAAMTAWLWFQFFEVVGMSMGLLPITGLPLPFMCYGGSSVVASVLAVAMILKQGCLDELVRRESAVARGLAPYQIAETAARVGVTRKEV